MREDTGAGGKRLCVFRTPCSAEIPVEKRSNQTKDTAQQPRGRLAGPCWMSPQTTKTTLEIEAGSSTSSSLSRGEVENDQASMTNEQL